MNAAPHIVAPPGTVEQLLHGMSRAAVLEVFCGLPAPSPGELAGEYRGAVHDGGDADLRARRERFFHDESSAMGFWLGKAYRDDDAGRGEGYNVCRRADGSIARHYRFRTELSPSPFDGRPSLMMYYGAFDSFPGGMDLVDEIRRVRDGLYLGIYTATQAFDGFSEMRPGQSRSEVDVFALVGPTGRWVGVDDPALEAQR